MSDWTHDTMHEIYENVRETARLTGHSVLDITAALAAGLDAHRDGKNRAESYAAAVAYLDKLEAAHDE